MKNPSYTTLTDVAAEGLPGTPGASSGDMQVRRESLSRLLSDQLAKNPDECLSLTTAIRNYPIFCIEGHLPVLCGRLSIDKCHLIR